MDLARRNETKIKSAFAKSIDNTNMAIRRGYESILSQGVRLCLDLHDEKHQRHLESGDSYGWVLCHNGQEVSRKLYTENKENIGNANAAIDFLVSANTQQGWRGIIVAGMFSLMDDSDSHISDPGRYFLWRYEFIPVRAAIRDLTQDSFSKYFKPI